jgi:hypothetical protein
MTELQTLSAICNALNEKYERKDDCCYITDLRLIVTFFFHILWNLDNQVGTATNLMDGQPGKHASISSRVKSVFFSLNHPHRL